MTNLFPVATPDPLTSELDPKLPLGGARVSLKNLQAWPQKGEELSEIVISDVRVVTSLIKRLAC